MHTVESYLASLTDDQLDDCAREMLATMQAAERGDEPAGKAIKARAFYDACLDEMERRDPVDLTDAELLAELGAA